MEKRSVEEIRAEIKEIDDDRVFKESEKEDLEDDLQRLEWDLEYLEEKQNKLLDELYDNYPVLEFTDDTREDIKGQFTRDGKWRVCNGFVLIESNSKFENLPESKGVDITFESLMQGEKQELSLDDICEDNIKNCNTYTFDGYLFNKHYVDRIVEIFGADNIESIDIYKRRVRGTCKASNMHIKAKTMQAVILGMVNLEE